MARIWRQAVPFMGAAWALTGGLLAGLALGWWLDRRFQSEPVFLLLGVLLGLVVGMAEVARVAFRSSRRGDDGEDP
ncbi:MAG: AtpZ/AtpI family protein [Acidobacteriota bacterium]|nr:AtpZ/AtpI family protein [Acidobacteriota bacterium]MDQ7088913.1 AtpZ/AtpI family protein [Acidobacteriota bacterium]